MTAIPHKIRAFARESYRHAMYTGHTSSYRARDNIAASVNLTLGKVFIAQDDNSYVVPIAASWL